MSSALGGFGSTLAEFGCFDHMLCCFKLLPFGRFHYACLGVLLEHTLVLMRYEYSVSRCWCWHQLHQFKTFGLRAIERYSETGRVACPLLQSRS